AVAWAACTSSGQAVTPRARLIEGPACRLSVELARARVIQLPAVLSLAGLFVRRDVDADLFAVRHDGRKPPLAQLVVRQSLEAVLELRRVHLLIVGESKPLHAERQHPVPGSLQIFFRAAP